MSTSLRPSGSGLDCRRVRLRARSMAGALEGIRARHPEDDPILDLASSQASKVLHAIDHDQPALRAARVIASELAAACASAEDLAMASDLTAVRDDAFALAYDLARAGVHHPARSREAPIARPAARLAAASARLLPVAERDRYVQEFRSELWDLAHAGAGLWRQLGYALRQLRNAIPLRMAVLSPHRKNVAP